MRKGITPVIALVMLMLITVGMVGIAYSWFSGLLSTQTEKGVSIPPGGAYCANKLISVLIQNNGATSNLLSSDIIIYQVDGNDAIKNGAFPAAGLAPGAGGLIISAFDCDGAGVNDCPSGARTIRIGTRTGVVESTAYCK